MNLKKIVRLLSAATVMAAASVSASAATVLDGWNLYTPNETILNIGRMNISGGGATVLQETDLAGNAYVGAKFSETGQIFNLLFQHENVVGAGDTSPVFAGSELLTINFSAVMGHVTALNAGGGFRYVFDSGTYTISGAGNVVYTTGTIVGVGGNASQTSVIGGVNGDSTLLGTIDTILATVDFTDNTNTSLKPQLATGAVLFEAVTNNLLSGTPFFTNCNFTPAGNALNPNAPSTCVSLNVTSDGSAYLVRAVPEPGTLALAGFALLGLGAARRRRTSAE